MTERDETILAASFDRAGAPKSAQQHERSRDRDEFQQILAQLERGAGAVAVNSGTAAIDLVLCLLPPGAVVIAPRDCSGDTWRLMTARALKGAIEIYFVDFSDPLAFGNALAREPALVWIESPSDPLLRISEISAFTLLAHAAGALVAVDNTIVSPLLQKPIRFAADFVVHASTACLSGHADSVGGAVVAAEIDSAEQLEWWARCTGVAAAPSECAIVLRGLRTLSVRLDRQQASARVIAQALDAHPAARVHYPGLASHPNHDAAIRQQIGFGAVLTLDMGDAAKAEIFLRRLDRFTLSLSPGGCASLVAHPASMSHEGMGPAARADAGVGEGLVRLSIGVEHLEDLLCALETALEAAFAKPAGRAAS